MGTIKVDSIQHHPMLSQNILDVLLQGAVTFWEVGAGLYGSLVLS